MRPIERFQIRLEGKETKDEQDSSKTALETQGIMFTTMSRMGANVNPGCFCSIDRIFATSAEALHQIQ